MSLAGVLILTLLLVLAALPGVAAAVFPGEEWPGATPESQGMSGAALERAAEDKRIKLVVMDLQHMSGAGLSKLQEVGAALKKFRASIGF